MASRAAGLRKTISLVRPILAVPSALGAGYIVQHIARSPKRRKRVFTRIMLGMSLHDLILSVVYLCYKLPVPAEARRGSTIFAVGTWASCDAFGMLFEGSRLTSILYNACLTQYYVLTIRYQWSEWKCRKRAELWLHLIPLIYGWIPAVVGIPLKAYAPVSFGCAVRSYPPGCRFKDPSSCIRGGKISAKIYSLAFLFVPLWLVFLYTVVALYLIYRQIASVEAASQRFSMKQLRSQELVSGNNSTTFHNTGDEPADSSSGRRRQSKEVVASAAAAAKKRSLKQKFAAQALLYCLAFFVTWIFASINGGRALIGNKKTFPAVATLNAIFTPLQGFWNALIYIWPRYRRYREKQLKEQEEAQERQRRQEQRQQRQQEQEQPQQQQHLPAADVAEAQGQAHDAAATIVYPGNRMTAMLQAISVAAEDDEDDYEYIIFGSMATSGAETAEDENDSDNDQEKREAGRRASF